MQRPWGRVTAPIATAAAIILFAGLTPPLARAAAVWSVWSSRSTIDAPATMVIVTITDLGNASAAYAIGCIKVSVPAAVGVTGQGIAGVTNGKVWTASESSGSPSIVTAHAVANADRLEGGTVQDSVDIAITVEPLRTGVTTWSVTVFRTKNCTVPSDIVQALSFTLDGVQSPTPTPAPTPTPTPIATRAPTATPAAPTPTPPAGGTSPTATPRSSSPRSPATSASPHLAVVPSVKPGAGHSSSPAPLSGGVAGVPPGPGDDDGGPREPDTFGLGRPGSAVLGATIQGLDSVALSVEWGVPAFVVGAPGLIIILVVLAQALGGSVWLPVVRRRIGSFGIGARR